jgi:hypothetical protein
VPVELASQLLSGPDLGGGFLFQLTKERPPMRAGFTFHLQDAGSDASEHPAGSPGLLGYAHPEVPCMYGGRECWHLELSLPESERNGVRVAYNRTRFVIGPMLAQAAGTRPSPIDPAMRELVERLAPIFAAANLPWQIGGSGAAYLRGAPIAVKDLDLGIPEEGLPPLTAALEEYLVEPNHPVPESGGSRSRGAAFLGTLKAGVRVEWWGARRVLPAGTPESEWEGPGWVERRTTVNWNGLTIPVSPIEFEIVRLAERGDLDRLRALRGTYARDRRDPSLLQELLASAQLSMEIAAELAGW